MRQLLDKTLPSFRGFLSTSSKVSSSTNFEQNFSPQRGGLHGRRPLDTDQAPAAAAVLPPPSRPRRGLTAGEQSQRNGDHRDDNGDPDESQQPLQEGL